VAYALHPAARGIELPAHATSTSAMDINIRNNIIVGFSVAGITARQTDDDYAAAITDMGIYDNILYGNGNSNDPLFTGVTLDEYTIETPIKLDPLFVSSPTDLHLSSPSSPAYHVGTSIVPPYNLGDYDGNTWNNPPSLGAYEYIEEGMVGVDNANLVKFSII
jgi:hypothetical protein